MALTNISESDILGSATDGRIFLGMLRRTIDEIRNKMFREYFLVALRAAEHYELNK